MASPNAYMMAAVGEEEEEAALIQGQDSAVETCFHPRNLDSDRLNVVRNKPLDIATRAPPSPKTDDICRA